MTYRLFAGMLAGALLALEAIVPARAVDRDATPAYAVRRVIGQCEVQRVRLPWAHLHASVTKSSITFLYGTRRIYQVTLSQTLPNGALKPLVRAAITIKEAQLLWCDDLTNPRARPLWH